MFEHLASRRGTPRRAKHRAEYRRIGYTPIGDAALQRLMERTLSRRSRAANLSVAITAAMLVKHAEGVSWTMVRSDGGKKPYDLASVLRRHALRGQSATGFVTITIWPSGQDQLTRIMELTQRTLVDALDVSAIIADDVTRELAAGTTWMMSTHPNATGRAALFVDSQLDKPDDAPAGEYALRKRSVQYTASADAALTRLMDRTRRNRTDAANLSVAITATMLQQVARGGIWTTVADGREEVYDLATVVEEHRERDGSLVALRSIQFTPSAEHHVERMMQLRGLSRLSVVNVAAVIGDDVARALDEGRIWRATARDGTQADAIFAY